MVSRRCAVCLSGFHARILKKPRKNNYCPLWAKCANHPGNFCRIAQISWPKSWELFWTQLFSELQLPRFTWAHVVWILGSGWLFFLDLFSAKKSLSAYKTCYRFLWLELASFLWEFFLQKTISSQVPGAPDFIDKATVKPKEHSRTHYDFSFLDKNSLIPDIIHTTFERPKHGRVFDTLLAFKMIAFTHSQHIPWAHMAAIIQYNPLCASNFDV